MKHEDTSNQESGQEKPVIRRDKVVVTKVTEQELLTFGLRAGEVADALRQNGWEIETTRSGEGWYSYACR